MDAVPGPGGAVVSVAVAVLVILALVSGGARWLLGCLFRIALFLFILALLAYGLKDHWLW